MAKDTANWLRMYAQQFEDQHAPQNMTIALREAAKEIERLRAGGCARDQSTTQYCAEAARLAAENERLRAALEDIAYPNPLHNEDDLMRIARTILEEPK